jgi:PAS domain S-box-containing protein
LIIFKRNNVKKETSIRRKLYSTATIVATTYIIFHLILLIFSNDIKTKWDNFDTKISQKINILSQIKLHIGYGGMIHAYKNYELQPNLEDYNHFMQHYDNFLQQKANYFDFQGITSLERHNLSVLENSFTQYKNNIKQMHTNNASKESLIDVDERQALNAIKTLDTFFKQQNTLTSEKINTTIQYIYILSIIVVVSIIIFTFYLKNYTEKVVMTPLVKIEKGLISFFKYLSNHKYSIEPIDIKTNDEFGIMAKSINRNIELTSKLHNELTEKNEEFENLVASYGKNVIASKTDYKGIITYASDAFLDISGYKREELIGKPHNIVRHPDMPQEAFKQMWETIESGNSWQGEVKNRKKNGDYYHVKATISPIFKNDNIIGYSAIREDITQQKEIVELNRQLDVYKNHLETKVKNATSQIQELMSEIEETQKEVVFTMGAIGERRSEETGFHVKRVAEYSKVFALYYGLSEEEAELLKQASPMHDIGKVGIPDSILNKPSALTQDEFEKIKEHTTLGYNMLKSSKRTLLKTAAMVANEHHERWDGKGYPNGLKGEQIHIYGRITAIADVFDALGSNRVYKKAWDDEKIFKLFKEERGKQFEPKLVDIFFEHLDEFLAIRDKFQDTKSEKSE